MSDLFEDDEELLEGDNFEDVDVDTEVVNEGLDARRRLEQMLEEKRLKYELDDW